MAEQFWIETSTSYRYYNEPRSRGLSAGRQLLKLSDCSKNLTDQYSFEHKRPLFVSLKYPMHCCCFHQNFRQIQQKLSFNNRITEWLFVIAQDDHFQEKKSSLLSGRGQLYLSDWRVDYRIKRFQVEFIISKTSNSSTIYPKKIIKLNRMYGRLNLWNGQNFLFQHPTCYRCVFYHRIQILVITLTPFFIYIIWNSALI